MYRVLYATGATIAGNTSSHIHIGSNLINTPEKLSLLLKTKFDIKIVHYFNREDFHPMPSVDCVLVYFKRKYKYDISKDEWNEYTSFISKSINNLRDVFTKNQIHAVIKYLGINLNNISEVSYNDWIQLFRYKQKID